MRETTTAPLIGWSRAFPATPTQVREARQFLTGILDGHPATDDAVLCLSELVTNATIHSRSREPGGHFRVRAEVHGSRVRVEVSDQGGPWEQSAKDDEQNGRGLLGRRPAGPQLRAHRGRPGGVDGLVRVRVDHRPRQRRPAARRGNHPPGPAADLHSRRPATAPAAPAARPVAGRTRRQAGVSLTTVARLERQSSAPCRGRTLGRLARALGEHPATSARVMSRARDASLLGRMRP